MDVRLTEEQQLLRQSARDFLTDRCPGELVRAAMDAPSSCSDPLWKAMSELGWPGLVVDEAHGGAGLDAVALSLVASEIGRVLAPVPLLSTAIATSAIQQSEDAAARDRWLPDVASGSVRLAFAQLESGSDWTPAGIGLEARPEGDGLRLHGRKQLVADADCAEAFVLPVRETGGGLALVVVGATADGVEVGRTAFHDPVRRMGSLRLEGALVAADGVLARGAAAERALSRVHDFAKVVLCGELCGVADRALELAVEYAKTREQFGQPIGRFQSIQHKCADMLVWLENMRSAALYAAWTVAEGSSDAHTSACLAKAYCSEAGPRVTGESIQIHGGLGFTWEQDPHLYYKRAKANELAFGSAGHNRELAARVLIDGREG